MDHVGKVFRRLVLFSKRLIYILSFKIPKSKAIWIYGAWRGTLFADNSKYLFLYSSSLNDGMKHIWITSNKILVQKLRRSGLKAYRNNSIIGIWLSLRASVVFETEGNADLIPWAIGGAKIIQLWHGMGIKDVSRWSRDSSFIPKYSFDYLIYAHKNDIWMTACQEAVMKYSAAYNIPLNRMFVTGQPKDDSFINTKRCKWIDNIHESHPDCKIVVYLPTHRDFGRHGQENMLAYDKLVHVNQELAAKNIVMIFKPHFHEFKNYEGMDTNLSNIIFATDAEKYGDVYEFLPACDALITDYSGIMLGYLTSGKPIIYFPYDKDTYMSSDAGFCYSYDEVTAGPICFNWKEVVEAVSEIFVDDKYIEAREKLRLRFSPFNDGKNSERVYQQVKKLLEEKNER